MIATYASYRYGSAKPITLPLFTKLKRKAIVEKIRITLDNFSLSPFEHEGACRAGLRSALCLISKDWHRSDAEAAFIVGEALRRNGAARPTWEEGQRAYVTPKENCAWCDNAIGEDLIGKSRFCCDVCTTSARTSWDFGTRKNYDLSYAEVHRAIKLTASQKRLCRHCGSTFRSVEANAQFCSRKCFGHSIQRVQSRRCKHCATEFLPKNDAAIFCNSNCWREYQAANPTYPPRNCIRCDAVFEPRKEDSKFCSAACSHAHKSNIRVEKECSWCSAPFIAKRRDARFCSSGCSSAEAQIRKGTWIPKKLSAPVFDFVFKMVS